MRTSPGFLTVEETATELGISPSGDYKLIQRRKLQAIRRSERGIRISTGAIRAYRARYTEASTDSAPRAGRPQTHYSYDSLTEAFEKEAGRAPGDWLVAWKAETIADTPDNMRLTMATFALVNWDELPESQRRSAVEPRPTF